MKNQLMKIKLYLIIVLIVFYGFQIIPAFALHDFASSPNPVGSGARAAGMGGAFISVADDATAPSWNPAGLDNLTHMGISFVFTGFYLNEKLKFANNPEGNGTESMTDYDLNYLSVVYPFFLFNKHIVVSVSYQNLYDFSRDWNFSSTVPTGALTSFEKHNYKQEGSLSAVGFACSINVMPSLSLGFTLNIWDDDLSENKWKQTYNYKLLQLNQPPIPPTTIEIYKNDEYSFNGVNANIGALWRASDEITVGFVLKTPFTADIRHYGTEKITISIFNPPTTVTKTIKNEKLDMPMSIGVGFSYRFEEKLLISADIYRTEWQDFVYHTSNGDEISMITNKTVAESDIDPTTQIRIGAEYLFRNHKYNSIIPARAGVFYDPAPANGSADDYYGCSIGSGIVKGRYVYDIAYQYRFANDVGSSKIVNEDGFSQDINEHTIYTSLTVKF